MNTSYQVGSALGLGLASALAIGATGGTAPEALNDGYRAAFLTAAAIAFVAALLALAKLRRPAAVQPVEEPAPLCARPPERTHPGGPSPSRSRPTHRSLPHKWARNRNVSMRSISCKTFDTAKHEEASRMPTLDTSLLQRVQTLMDTNTGRELLSTTGLQATVDELVRRNHALEQALHEIALEVQRLGESSEH